MSITNNQSAPMLREIGAVIRFLRGTFYVEQVVEPGSIAVEKETGWIYYPGESIPLGAEVDTFERGVPAGVVEIEGQICPDSCNSRRIYYRLSESYCLAGFLFEEIPKAGRWHLDYDEPERRFLDLDAIHRQAAKDLALTLQEYRPHKFLLGGDDAPALYEWAGPPIWRVKEGTVATRYEPNHI